MAENSFKELERRTISEIGPVPDQIKKKISLNMGLFRFIGDLFELYIPNFAKSIVSLTGGSPSDTPKPKYPNQE